MKPSPSIRSSAILLVLAACGSGDDSSGDEAAASDGSAPSTTTTPSLQAPEASSQMPSELAGCERGTLEADFTASPLMGPGVTDGAVAAGDYVLSTTYLQLAPDAESQRLFQQLVEPITEDLQTRAGLVAVSLGLSEACGVARTLAVWEDDAAMIAFVTSAAHAAAMVRVTDISRGGSVVTHWTGDAAAASWATAVERIGADDGPQY